MDSARKKAIDLGLSFLFGEASVIRNRDHGSYGFPRGIHACLRIPSPRHCISTLIGADFGASFTAVFDIGKAERFFFGNHYGIGHCGKLVNGPAAGMLVVAPSDSRGTSHSEIHLSHARHLAQDPGALLGTVS
jgi:hypothetical protein